MDDNETRYCFRCNGLAVIDKSFLVFLPGVLNRAAELLKHNDLEIVDQDEIEQLITALQQYSIMLGALPDD